MHLSKIGTGSAVDIMFDIGHAHLRRGRLDAGRLSICGPATSWDTYCGDTQFGDFLLSTLKWEFLSSSIIPSGYLCNAVAVMYKGKIMEYAPTETLYQAPLHPCTRKLLAAIPEPEPDRRDNGQPAKPESEEDLLAQTPPKGCLFQDRCDAADQNCHADNPTFIRVAAGHYVRCWQVEVSSHQASDNDD